MRGVNRLSLFHLQVELQTKLMKLICLLQVETTTCGMYSMVRESFAKHGGIRGSAVL